MCTQFLSISNQSQITNSIFHKHSKIKEFKHGIDNNVIQYLSVYQQKTFECTVYIMSVLMANHGLSKTSAHC